MKFRFLLINCLFLLASIFTTAKADLTQDKMNEIQSAVDLFHLEQAIGIQFENKHLDPRCDRPDRGRSCVNSVCERIGQYRCDDISEIREVNRVCRGVRSGRCIDNVCERLGQYRCDDLSEIRNVAEVCQNIAPRCVDAVCKKLGQYRCDDFSEIRNVAQICQNSTRYVVQCLEDTCQRLGQYRCDDFSEVRNVLNICSGN